MSGTYDKLPYLNVNNEDAISLNDLFSYEQLKIPPLTEGEGEGEADTKFHILNIKKQFICVTKQGKKSEIYVKRSTIEQGLELINNGAKPMQGKIKFTHGKNPIGENDDDGGIGADAKTNFDAVYIKIQDKEMPTFSLVAPSREGGRKGGGTRKTQGGSRSR